MNGNKRLDEKALTKALEHSRTLLIDSALLLVHRPDVFAFRFG
jgi:hypothetical protein